jgi:hypothetical protein
MLLKKRNVVLLKHPLASVVCRFWRFMQIIYEILYAVCVQHVRDSLTELQLFHDESREKHNKNP